MRTDLYVVTLPIVVVALLQNVTTAEPVGTAFSYQGKLEFAASPVTDTCDFQFSLWDGPQSQSQIGPTLQPTDVGVDGGLFTVWLDFGTGVFSGDVRWLEVWVTCSEDPDWTTLIPRQELTPAPYALYAENTGGVAGDIHEIWGVDGLAGGGSEGTVFLSIALEGVTTDKLAPGAVAGDKIASGGVTTDALGLGVVTTDRLFDGAVDNAKLSMGAVSSNKILDGSALYRT